MNSESQFTRTELLFGTDAVEKLKKAKVAVFGIGGVGGYVAEVLARSGVGELHLIDNDRVVLSNLNRQIFALHSTIGHYKVDVAEARIHDINPECTVKKYKTFYLPENADEIDLSTFDYVVDCIDTVKAKLELARRCHRLQVPIIASMGAARKTDPTAFCVTDLAKTQGDPLAKVIRKTLRKEGINHMKVVYSQENDNGNSPLPTSPRRGGDGNDNIQPSMRPPLPSCAFVPAAAGIIIGGEVVKDLIKFYDYQADILGDAHHSDDALHHAYFSVGRQQFWRWLGKPCRPLHDQDNRSHATIVARCERR